MQLGIIGLGRMGSSLTRRLLGAGHACVVYDIDPTLISSLVAEGAVAADSLVDLVRQLTPPRRIWVMLPAGTATEATIAALGEMLAPADTIIDGGNTDFRDDIRRGRELAARHISYVDVGTSGGVWGLTRGYCLMVGGPAATVTDLDPILRDLAPGPGDLQRTARAEGSDLRPELGYVHAGPVGAGHFVKMVHNGVEYGLMQAYAEGFDILRGRASEVLPAEARFDLNLADIAEAWRRGSVISSWLLDLAAQALASNPGLDGFSGRVADSGEARWVVEAAIEEAVPADVLATALFARFRSREDHTFGERLLSAMRAAFGGHREPPPQGQNQ
ncbi:phosphogluconate dehydrogenase (NAD(+)-dependent, decarboxylating) [Phenylobacterium aquaticum]|uniref:phosphogluconate dehydrogenase (NAD(+)-dependent, decarboxylating) n=1 Tax=Phenylobacterium aquaticum TaxID=1763816 RepID=UPI001F5CD42F|nr:decarboxylating 6-phosphogluconate dehydrogenase [Phenylobacterium aquaticum]MCI3130847.1 decarboxylating 6-phosphogluconate dehydrogenase [Phenylobacterium aquaticum]